MELHPELKRRFARILEAHPRLFAQMKARAGPFWWHASRELLAEVRACDVALATENGCWVVRADVAGVADGLGSEG
jgi:hypothetical protein